jgi:uncharacterized protein (AIM24 family)
MAQTPLIPTSSDRAYQCPWCRHASTAATTNCPACGAPVDVRLSVTKSGWTELPAIRDMAKIQFGQSFCQIEGKYVPVADFNLAAGDGVYFAHHLLLWKDPKVEITTMPLAKGWKRLLAGLPLVMTQAMGPGRIAFSKDKPGELIAVPLDIGQSIHVREHVLMIATHSVSYDWFNTGIWFQIQEEHKSEMHYPIGMFMDRFTAVSAPGLLLLHGGGNVFMRNLAAGETISIKPTSLLFKDPTVHMKLDMIRPMGAGLYGRRCVLLQLRGPGRVAMQSNYEPVEEPPLQASISAS